MNIDGMIHAVSKFYGSGFEFIVFNINSANKDAAVALSNFVESQDSGVLLVNMTTPAGQTPDFSSVLDTIKANRTTKPVSLTADKDVNSNFGYVALGKYGGRELGANFEFMQNLPEVSPQDELNFTPNDLRAYEKYNVATYAYMNGKPMTTNGKTITGFDVGALVVKDALRKEMISQISQYITDNDVVSYTDTSILNIRSIENGILNDFTKRGLIEDAGLNPMSNELTDEVKASGIYKDSGYHYKPVRSIDHVTLTQTLNITKEE